MPSSQGAAGTVLTNSGTGTLSWGPSGTGDWSLTGNTGTSAGTNYIGTNDNQSFEIHVDQAGTATEGRHRVARFEPAILSPNIILGHNSNALTGGYQGVTISGGGETTKPNEATGNYATVGGGLQNKAGSWGTVAGGQLNRATQSYAAALAGHNNEASGQFAIVGGGEENKASGSYSAVGGGYKHVARGANSFIGGGDHNETLTPARYATIAGGHHNQAAADLSFVGGGGTLGHIEPLFSNMAQMPYSTVVGGSYNVAGIPGNGVGKYSFVGGGGFDIASNPGYQPDGNSAQGDYSVVVGGSGNRAVGNFTFIGGGGDLSQDLLDPLLLNEYNEAVGDYSVVVGGKKNWARSSTSAIGGGANNHIHFATGADAVGSTIAGGWSNEILIATGTMTTSYYSTIGGGVMNQAQGSHATVAGGTQNKALHEHTFIGGGNDNKSEAQYGTITGGQGNQAKASHAFVGGGALNFAEAAHSTIGGGSGNKTFGQFSAIGGGSGNSTVNTVAGSAIYTTIPGGLNLEARSFGQTVIGHNNYRQGTRTTFDNNEDRLFIIGNGNGDPSQPTKEFTNAFEVSSNGHSIVFDELSYPDVGTTELANPATPPVYGGTYDDNIIYAWGDVPLRIPEGPVITTSSFGVVSVIRTGANGYIVQLNVIDPHTLLPMNLNQGSVTATLTHSFSAPTVVCGTISTSNIVNNQFTVYTHEVLPTGCNERPLTFTFKVTGRRFQ